MNPHRLSWKPINHTLKFTLLLVYEVAIALLLFHFQFYLLVLHTNLVTRLYRNFLRKTTSTIKIFRTHFWMSMRIYKELGFKYLLFTVLLQRVSQLEYFVRCFYSAMQYNKHGNSYYKIHYRIGRINIHLSFFICVNIKLNGKWYKSMKQNWIDLDLNYHGMAIYYSVQTFKGNMKYWSREYSRKFSFRNR